MSQYVEHKPPPQQLPPAADVSAAAAQPDSVPVVAHAPPAAVSSSPSPAVSEQPKPAEVVANVGAQPTENKVAATLGAAAVLPETKASRVGGGAELIVRGLEGERINRSDFATLVLWPKEQDLTRPETIPWLRQLVQNATALRQGKPGEWGIKLVLEMPASMPGGGQEVGELVKEVPLGRLRGVRIRPQYGFSSQHTDPGAVAALVAVAARTGDALQELEWGFSTESAEEAAMAAQIKPAIGTLLSRHQTTLQQLALCAGPAGFVDFSAFTQLTTLKTSLGCSHLPLSVTELSLVLRGEEKEQKEPPLVQLPAGLKSLRLDCQPGASASLLPGLLGQLKGLGSVATVHIENLSGPHIPVAQPLLVAYADSHRSGAAISLHSVAGAPEIAATNAMVRALRAALQGGTSKVTAEIIADGPVARRALREASQLAISSKDYLATAALDDAPSDCGMCNCDCLECDGMGCTCDCSKECGRAGDLAALVLKLMFFWLPYMFFVMPYALTSITYYGIRSWFPCLKDCSCACCRCCCRLEDFGFDEGGGSLGAMTTNAEFGLCWLRKDECNCCRKDEDSAESCRFWLLWVLGLLCWLGYPLLVVFVLLSPVSSNLSQFALLMPYFALVLLCVLVLLVAAWRDPALTDVKVRATRLQSWRNPRDMAALLGLAFEFWQLCSLSFLEPLFPPRSGASGFSIALFSFTISEETQLQAQFWVVVVVVLAIVSLVGRLHVDTMMEQAYLVKMAPWFEGVVDILTGTFYLTLVTQLLSWTACQYQDTLGVSTLDTFPDLQCWSGEHLLYAAISLLLVPAYVGASSWMGALYSETLRSQQDIKTTAAYAVTERVVKLIVGGAAIYFTTELGVRLVIVLCGQVVLLLVVAIHRPYRDLGWVNLVKTLSLAFTAWTSICALWANSLEDPTAAWGPATALFVGWGVMALVFTALYHLTGCCRCQPFLCLDTKARGIQDAGARAKLTLEVVAAKPQPPTAAKAP